MTDLRKLARQRWRENHEHEQRVETRRRLAVSFFFGLGVTLATAMVGETVAQRLFGRAADQIKRGLGHGE